MKKESNEIFWGITFLSMGLFGLIPNEIIPDGLGWLFIGAFIMIYSIFKSEKEMNQYILSSLSVCIMLIGIAELTSIEMNIFSILFIGLGVYLIISRDKVENGEEKDAFDKTPNPEQPKEKLILMETLKEGNEVTEATEEKVTADHINEPVSTVETQSVVSEETVEIKSEEDVESESGKNIEIKSEEVAEIKSEEIIEVKSEEAVEIKPEEVSTEISNNGFVRQTLIEKMVKFFDRK